MGKFIVRDTFFKKAKEEGYRARAAYKLKEIQTKFHVFKRSDRILDLGCAPGSWLQVISEIVGPQGSVVGIDVAAMTPLPQRNIVTFQRDIRELNISTFFDERSQGVFDAVTCDIAPNLSGIREVDDRHIQDLHSAIKRAVEESLKSGGNFVFKSFFSDDFKAYLADLRKMFKKVSVFKPLASRSVSSEIYLVCMGRL
jgi:23S rRNA (uridine2552-2'-O)-methyltransferase